MTDEARKALARLGSKLRLYARSSSHIQVIDSAAWGIVLLDLSEVERGFVQREAELDIRRQWNEELSALNLKWAKALARHKNSARPQVEQEAECTCSLSVRESGHGEGCPEYFHQSGKPLKKIYIGFDRACDEGDEASARFYRRNDDGSITILAELRGEAAEYVAELESEFNDLSHRFSCVLVHATGGKMSKTNYTKEAMYREIDGRIQDLYDEAVKKLKDSLPKGTLRWDGDRHDGEGAYICIYCDEELPRLGAIVHKTDCIQATRFR